MIDAIDANTSRRAWGFHKDDSIHLGYFTDTPFDEKLFPLSDAEVNYAQNSAIHTGYFTDTPFDEKLFPLSDAEVNYARNRCSGCATVYIREYPEG